MDLQQANILEADLYLPPCSRDLSDANVSPPQTIYQDHSNYSTVDSPIDDSGCNGKVSSLVSAPSLFLSLSKTTKDRSGSYDSATAATDHTENEEEEEDEDGHNISFKSFSSSSSFTPSVSSKASTISLVIDKLLDLDDEAPVATTRRRTTMNDISANEFTNESHASAENAEGDRILRVAILGCGMMGQEHCSYIVGYSDKLRIDYLCDPHSPSIEKCLEVMNKFTKIDDSKKQDTIKNLDKKQYPNVLSTEDDLMKVILDIDLLVVATPNYLHTDTLLRFGTLEHLTILLEKPVAVSIEQHTKLSNAVKNDTIKARVWVAMEYRFIPAIAKLIELIPTVIGTTSSSKQDESHLNNVHMVTIRENRFPFLTKVDNWNRSSSNTGDTLVEKCCHFFDLMRLITKKEVDLDHIRSIVQRGINYHDEHPPQETQCVSQKYQGNQNVDDSHSISTTTSLPLSSTVQPIIDSAYVLLPFQENKSMFEDHPTNKISKTTIGCLELCMFADGSRHQEEVIVTGPWGRLEAYLPENKVYEYRRPNANNNESKVKWIDRSVPPPQESIQCKVHDCSSIKDVFFSSADHQKTTVGSEKDKINIPTHGGYHYCSTAIEWYKLLECMEKYDKTGTWEPDVSLTDGLRAVEIGLVATAKSEP